MFRKQNSKKRGKQINVINFTKKFNEKGLWLFENKIQNQNH